jgi:L-arabinose isomerase
MLKGSGSVGTLQTSGFLRREGYSYTSVSGYYEDPDVLHEIVHHCLAIGTAQKLRDSRCGVLPFRCEQMSTTYVDEFELRTRYGVELKYLELAPLREIARSFDSGEVSSFRKLLEKEGYVIEVDEKNLDQGIRYALALDRITRTENLQMFTMNDVIDEMHSQLGLRPCLPHPGMSERGVVVSMEADIAAVVAMYALRLFTGQAPFYSELFTADLERNAFLMGHAGYHDAVNADPDHPPRIVPDVEYENTDSFTGACIYFKYRPGPVTVINSVYTGERLRWHVFEGESLPGPHKMAGSCHLFCSVDIPVPQFFKRIVAAGASQHFVVVSGRLKGQIETLCRWLDIEFLDLLTNTHPVRETSSSS